MPLDLILVIELVAEDDDLVAHRALAGRRAVQRDRAAPPLAGDHVGRDPLSVVEIGDYDLRDPRRAGERQDRKSTRLNSSHVRISYAVFCLKTKQNNLYA